MLTFRRVALLFVPLIALLGSGSVSAAPAPVNLNRIVSAAISELQADHVTGISLLSAVGKPVGASSTTTVNGLQHWSLAFSFNAAPACPEPGTAKVLYASGSVSPAKFTCQMLVGISAVK